MSIFATVKQMGAKIFFPPKDPAKQYYKRARQYSFSSDACKDEHQYEALITKLYHAVEKGLSYENYRAGFGRGNIEQLMILLEQYSEIRAFLIALLRTGNTPLSMPGSGRP